MTTFIERMKRLTRRNVVPPGPLKSGLLVDIFKADRHVVLIAITDRGVMYQIADAKLEGGTVTPIAAPRKSIDIIFEQFGVEDIDIGAYRD